MRRTGLSAMALACAAVLAGAVPAFADGTTSPSPVPSQMPSDATEAAPSAVPSKAPSTEPTRAPSDDQVSVRPSGAPNTGEVTPSSGSGTGTLVGGGAAAAVVLGGGILVIRRRRANGV